MSGNGSDPKHVREEPTEVEPVEEAPLDGSALPEIPLTAEFGLWKLNYLANSIPSLYLDSSLKILRANEQFRLMFGSEAAITGQYLTQFFSPSFDDIRSSDLFRSILSPATGYSWHGQVQRLGRERLLTISKVWVVPIGEVADSSPKAYSAICLDITDEHHRLLQSTFSSLLQAARLKDNDTGNHIDRVNLYSRAVAVHLMDQYGTPAVDREFVESIGLVSALHDVGKIGTPDDILNKAGKLEAWEWDVMKQHTTNGAYILSTYPNPMAREIALRHHEWWDGSGYPHGLSGELIPLAARIVAIADVYDALRMHRSYKEAYTHELTVAQIIRESGTHFDPFLVECFRQIADTFETTYTELADSN